MFLYWDGYEIDGSDTDFNIILPENIQYSDFIDCFLSIPIFDKSIEPEIVYRDGEYDVNKAPASWGKERSMTFDTFKLKVLLGEMQNFKLSINCLHIEELDENLRQEIYSFSERREPHEDAYGKTENPCTIPFKQDYYSTGLLTVKLILKKGYNFITCCDDDKVNEIFKGYVINVDLLNSKGDDTPCLSINVGPIFYYEYAMYIVEYMRKRFPSVAMFGGLDCKGGRTYDCTYSSSLYEFEKFTIPVEQSVKNTLKRLCGYGVLCAGIENNIKNEIKSTKDFYLTRTKPSYIFGTLDDFEHLNFNAYIEHVESALKARKTPFKTICGTAVRIVIPKPEEFNSNKYVYENLEKVYNALKPAPANGFEYYLLGHFGFTDKKTAEFRVHYSMKNYFKKLLELMESGELEFMKNKTCFKCHEE
jgi:hypothetical protein